jgi:RND family efflux transporter MFP subunit
MTHPGDLHPILPREETFQKLGVKHSETPPPPAPRGSDRTLVTVALIVMAALVICVVGAIISRMTAARGLRKATEEAAILSVNVVHPAVIKSADEIALPGSAQAYVDTPIFARTSGYLKSWNVDIGQHVKRGQVLAQIETPEVDQQLDQARSDLKNAQANLDLSQITAKRQADLFKRRTVSSEQFDQAASDLTSKKALVDSGMANVRRLEQMKAFEQVVAPYDGVITARSTDIGALIQAGNATGAKELFHLADNRILRVFFSVPEAYSSIIKAGEIMSFTFDSFPEETFKGELVRDTSALDPRSHTLMAEADVENPGGRIYPGGYATAHLKLSGTANAMTIPANTLLFRAEDTFVALIRDGHVALAPIKIGRDHGHSFEVLEGVTANDSIILDPPDSLPEGAAVRVEPASKAGE